MKRKKVLFVCTGNTCRSPMAEALLRSKIKKNKIKWWDVASCGIHATAGSAMSKNSALALKEIGISSEKFKSKQINHKSVSSSVLVVCMTSAHKQMIEDCGNLISIKDIMGYDVPDPYGCDLDAYRHVRDILSQVCDIIIDKFITKYKD